MKTSSQIMFLLILLTLFSCNQQSPKTKVDTIKEQVETKKQLEANESIIAKNQDTISIDSFGTLQRTVAPHHYEYLFVSVMSGIDYRESPKGKVLGRFPVNTRLNIIEYTKILDEIIHEKNTVKGEWLGIENEKDTVYVFGGFLSYYSTYSDINIYQATSFYVEKNGDTRTGFLNLSETYFKNKEPGNFILPENNLKDTIPLSPKQREKFLNTIGVTEFDNIFIYEINTDTVLTFRVAELPAIACINIYYWDYTDPPKTEQEFLFGFDLGKSYNGSYENFVYVGKENPFQLGKFKPMIWEKIDDKRFPKNIGEVKDSIEIETLLYSSNNLDFFIRKSAERAENYQLVIVDNAKNTIVYDENYHGSESRYLTVLNTEKSKPQQNGQWAGELFKDKPLVIYGFLGVRFGCPQIDFIDKNEPPILTLCDNRH